MQITKEQTITASDGKEYQVSATYDSDSGVPMDAELEVTELLEGTEAYDAYVQKAAEKLDTKPEYLAYAPTFDIKLVNPETGEHYQPTKPVAVSIELESRGSLTQKMIRLRRNKKSLPEMQTSVLLICTSLYSCP